MNTLVLSIHRVFIVFIGEAVGRYGWQLIRKECESMRKPNHGIRKFISSTGWPMLYVPGNQLEYCDKHKYPVLIVWKRTRYADVTWLNEPFQRSHGDLWQQPEFQEDIEGRAGTIFQRYAIRNKSARAIQPGFMTLYELTIVDAEKAACELFDMTLEIVAEYESKQQIGKATWDNE